MLERVVSKILDRSFLARKVVLTTIYRADNPGEPKGKVQIGKYTFGVPKLLSWRSDDKLVVGKFCMFASNVIVLMGGEHDTTKVTVFPLKKKLQNLETTTLIVKVRDQ